MTKTQKLSTTQTVMVNRAKANGGILRLDNPMMLAAARSIPGEIAYVISNTLVLIGEKA